MGYTVVTLSNEGDDDYLRTGRVGSEARNPESFFCRAFTPANDAVA
jgi:hypothetical protein